jgi:hypothetical protein
MRRLSPLRSRDVVIGVSVLSVAFAGSLAIALIQSARAEDLTEKERIEQRYQREKLVSPAPGGDPVKERPTVRVTNPPAPTGILDSGFGPFPSAEFLGTNRWQGFVGDHLVAVIAGGTPHTALGRLMVLTMDMDDRNVLEVRRIELPGDPGPARVASANGTNLLIQTESGRSFVFEVSTKHLTPGP